MTTLLQAVKQIVSFADEAELRDLGYAETNLYQVYMKEYGNHNGFHPKAITEYCQGLPNIASFAFQNFIVLDELKERGVERKTEKGQIALIEQYWNTVGYVVFRHLEKNM